MESGRRVSDFVLAPAVPAEVAARTERLFARPAWSVERLHRLMAHAVDRTSDLVEIADPDAVLAYVNRAWEVVLGWSPEEAVGRTPAELVRSDVHPPAFFEDLHRTLASGGAWSGVVVSKARSGALVHLDTTITPVADDGAGVTHHLAVKRDITAEVARRDSLVEANRALERARDAAEAASRTKSEFLANMSHELRTPLNAIIGYSEMLIDELAEDPASERDLRRIRAAGVHLLALINDVLDISKIEADKIEVVPEVVDLRDLVDGVAATAESMAVATRDRFSLRCDAAIGAVRVDPRRLRQVLLNLLSNAFKFTRGGEVELTVAREATELRFRVRDTGIGISPDQQARLFLPFVQVDASSTRSVGGTGLGLAISRSLVERMGGRITVQSALGQGATFEVTLPAGDAPAAAAGVDGACSPLVLLIDDDPDLRDVFGRLMQRRGFRVAAAASGAEGLALAEQLVPHVIVLDVRMPGMSGWDVLTSLKLSERLAGVPVVMLTATPDRDLGRALGAVDHVAKPFDADVLSATLRRHLVHTGARVLVVDDDEPTRALLTRGLTRQGYRVATAEDGQRALDLLPEFRPDLVLLDLMMPVMDGFTFLDRIRADPQFAHLPVVVATARVLSGPERDQISQAAQRIVVKQGQTLAEVADAVTGHIEAAIGRGHSDTK